MRIYLYTKMLVIFSKFSKMKTVEYVSKMVRFLNDPKVICLGRWAGRVSRAGNS